MRAAKAAGSSRKGRAKLYRIKVISLGEQAAGKSCLIKRCEKVEFSVEYLSKGVCLLSLRTGTARRSSFKNTCRPLVLTMVSSLLNWGTTRSVPHASTC